MLDRWFRGERKPDEVPVRYDPSLTRTIALAVAAGLLQRNANHTLTLSRRGRDLAKAVWTDENVMALEKNFLRRLPVNISQKQVRELLEWR